MNVVSMTEYIFGITQKSWSGIKLISLYHEYESPSRDVIYNSGDVIYISVPSLDASQISSIIQGYGIPKDQADRWSEFCSGSPRVAHVIGQNLKNNRQDIFRSPDTVNIWDRYIVGSDDAASSQVQQRWLVLRHLALFKRFGYGRAVVTEAQAIAAKIRQADPQITWPRFQEIIQTLRARRILQGEHSLYVTPKLLQIKLWIDW
jgi:hypothetical protein